MARLCTLASGSSGNCTYLGSGSIGILIDAAPNAKAVLSGLCEIGVQKESIKAIFITHAHEDHIAALKVLTKKINVPIFATPKTAEHINASGRFENFTVQSIQDTIEIEGITVKSFETSHDIEGSCGYTVTFKDGLKFGLCTDLGVVTETVTQNLLGCAAAVVEANHDVTMLQQGPYPYPLKRRILSDFGHLSNGSSAKLVSFLVKNGTTHLVLAHLSRENNTPEIAKRTVVAALMSEGLVEGVDYTLTVAPVGCGGVIVC